MSYSIRLTGAPDGDASSEFHFGSNRGTRALSQWVMSLSKNAYPRLRELIESGETKDTEALAIEMEDAIKQKPSENPEVKHTAEEILSRIGVGDPGETATIFGHD